MALFILVFGWSIHLASYEDPSQPGSLGKVSAFVKAQSILREKAQRQL